MGELEKLRARLVEIDAEQRKSHETAGAEALTEDQQRAWDDLDKERDELKTREGELVEIEARAARVADSRAKFGANILPDRNDDPTDGVTFRSTMTMPGQELQSRALKLLDEKRENTAHFEDLDPAQFGGGDRRAKVERMIRKRTSSFNGEYLARLMLLTESKAYRSAFHKLITGGVYFTPEEGRALEAVSEMRAALNITTDTQGGFAVPVLIDPTVIWTAQGHPNDFLQIARVENITNDEWRGISSAGATAYWATEGVATTAGEPAIAQPTVVTKKLTAYVKYSVEIGGDWPGFAGEMATAIDAVWQEEQVDKFTNGLGTTAQPYGVITRMEATAASQVLVSSDGTIVAADVYALWKALPIKYRRSSRWMSSTDVENAIRQAGTTDPNFTVNLLSEGIPALFARPYHENDYMDAMAAVSTSDTTPLLLGDFKNFLIANRVGMSIENVQLVMDTTTGTPTGQRALYAWGRIGSDVINTNAFRILSQT